MLTYRSEKYSGCVARLSASDLPPLSTRSTSSTMKRKPARSVSSLVMDSARSSGTPALSSVDSSWVKNSTSRRRPRAKAGSFSSNDFFGLNADVDRDEPLPAQLARHGLVGLPAEAPGADLAVRGHRPEEEAAPSEFLRHAQHFLGRGHARRGPSSSRPRAGCACRCRRAAAVSCDGVRVGHDQRADLVVQLHHLEDADAAA